MGTRDYKKEYIRRKEKCCEYGKKYYEINKEKIKEYNKYHYEKNKEYYKQYYEKNKEHFKEKYEKNKQKILINAKDKYAKKTYNKKLQEIMNVDVKIYDDDLEISFL